MVLPIIYRKNQAVQAQYDFEDLLAGFGYKTYYLTIDLTQDPTTGVVTKSYNLLSKLMGMTSDNDAYYISGTETQAAWTEIINKDFDYTFGQPAIVSGDFYIEFTAKNTSSNANAVYHQPIITVYHVTSGGTETSLGTTNGTIMSATNVAPTYYRLKTKVNLTKKSFGVGEKLRVTIQVYHKHPGAAATGVCYLYFDPESKATFTDILGRTIDTDAYLNIPFIIDL